MSNRDQADGSPAAGHGTHTYDGIGRLTDYSRAPFDPANETYEFDSVGNLKKKNGTTYQYDPQRPHELDSVGDLQFQHDVYGRQATKQRFNGAAVDSTLAYDWNTLGQMTSVTLTPASGPTEQVDYQYDYKGQRVAKTVNGSDTTLYFGKVVDINGGLLTKYYFAGDQLIARRTGPTPVALLPAGFGPTPGWRIPPAIVIAIGSVTILLLIGWGRGEKRIGVSVSASRAAGTVVLVLIASLPVIIFLPSDAIATCSTSPPDTTFFHTDHIGSVTLLTDEDAGVVEFIRYTPYGEIRGRWDAQGTPLSGSTQGSKREFTGYETQEVSGLQYAGARFYDPETAQFVAPDPEEQFASPYSYTGWDPVNRIDPDGRWAFLAALAFGLLVKGLDYASQAINSDSGGASSAPSGFSLNIGGSIGANGVTFGSPVALSAPPTAPVSEAVRTRLVGLASGAGQGAITGTQVVASTSGQTSGTSWTASGAPAATVASRGSSSSSSSSASGSGQLNDAHGLPVNSSEDFAFYAAGKSLEQLQTEERPTLSMFPSLLAGGPDSQYRMVQDPQNSGVLIDMRHFLVVGPRGEVWGATIEAAQWLGRSSSGWNAQDFRSNALGAQFFNSAFYQPTQNNSVGTQIDDFLRNR